MVENSGIYVISSPSGRVYIESSKQLKTRKTQHFYKLRKGIHPCDALQKAFIKYKLLNFVIIENCDIDNLIEREQFWIDNSHLIWNKQIYNSSRIAGRPEHTADVRKKMSDAAKGRKVSEETKLKLSEIKKGIKHTEETRKKLSESHKNKPPISEETRAKISANSKKMWELKSNRAMSDETKEKIKAARSKQIMRPISEEHKQKISEANRLRKGVKVSNPVALANMREGGKKRSEAARLKRAKLD